MLKRVLATLCVLMLVVALVPAAFAEEIGDGYHIVSQNNGDGYSGAEILTGSDASVWPFATSGDFTTVPFEKDATYRLTFNVTSTGCAGFRVRWAADDNAGYTADDTEQVNNYVFTADQTANIIPAYFQDTIASGETKTYTVEFKADGSQVADGLIGNVYIRGQSGNNDFVINALKFEKVGGDVLVNYGEIDTEAPAAEAPAAETPAEAPAAETPAATENKKTGDETPIAIAVILLLSSVCAALVFTRKRNSENA